MFPLSDRRYPTWNDAPGLRNDFGFAFFGVVEVSQPPLPGDVNGDAKVDLTDFGILKANFGDGTTVGEGDFNNDGAVDLADFGILKDNFGRVAAAVPEPSSGILAIICSTGLAWSVALRRRAKKGHTP